MLSEKLTYRFRRPRRWEVMQFWNTEGLLVAKRVIGLPGENVSIVDHQVCINGEPIDRPASLQWLSYYAYGNLRKGQSVDCGNGYYVLGDSSDDSYDSRFEGPVPPDRIVARGWMILRPLKRLRFITP